MDDTQPQSRLSKQAEQAEMEDSNQTHGPAPEQPPWGLKFLKEGDSLPMKKLHFNQCNVGLELIRKFVEKSCLVSERTELLKYKKINVLVIGPVFTRLRKQTNAQLNLLLSQPQASMFRRVAVEAIGSAEVGNWLTDLKSKEDWLHILVHDEAHWGIAEESKINKHLHDIAAALTGKSRHFLFLGVSATLEVLTLGNERPKFVWDHLNNSLFAAPSYLSVAELDYICDSTVGRLDESSASQHVVDEYTDACRNFLTGTVGSNIADKVIADLSDTDKVVVAAVRLAKIEHADKLCNQITAMKVDFEVFHASSPSRADNDNDNDDDSNKLVGFKKSTLLVLVDTVRMGDEVDNRCLHWDVRARYRSNGIYSRATFVQDVGRCAGHNKPGARVYVGLDLQTEAKTQTTFNTVNSAIKRMDRLLTRRDQPTSAHPDAAVQKVYADLARYMVFLVAQPQLGKTGAILSFLHVLEKEIQEVHAEAAFQPQRDGWVPLPREITCYSHATRAYYFLPRSEMLKELGNPDNWKSYHETMSNLNNHWEESAPSALIAQHLLWYSETVDSILDVGCGTGALLSQLIGFAEPGDLHPGMKYIGMDIPANVDMSHIPAAEHSISVSYHSGDYVESLEALSNLAPQELQNVVFSLSLAWNYDSLDISELMRRVARILRPNGALWIADMKFRLDQEFAAFLQSIGFKYQKKFSGKVNDTLVAQCFVLTGEMKETKQFSMKPKWKDSKDK